MIYILIPIFAVVVFIIIYLRLYLHLCPRKRLPILMYHHVLPQADKNLTVSVEELDKQFRYLKNKGYKTLFFRELEENESLKKKIILTFDDGYRNNKEYLIPLLKKYNLKATIFLPTAQLEADDDKMGFEELHTVDINHIEFALHSHSHQNFRNISLNEVDEDIEANIRSMENSGLPYSKVLAYPFGKYPKENNQQFFDILEKYKIDCALRIGNKIDSYPFRNKYEVHRIDIKGADNMKIFTMKLIFGRFRF
ncbi:MAG: polysaccharide deacetylase family protein [Bacteroidales bacterium]